MLVIKRRVGEAFWVGHARIKIEDIGGGNVKFSVDAPRGIEVLREEIIVQRAGPKNESDQEAENE